MTFVTTKPPKTLTQKSVDATLAKVAAPESARFVADRRPPDSTRHLQLFG